MRAGNSVFSTRQRRTTTLRLRRQTHNSEHRTHTDSSQLQLILQFHPKPPSSCTLFYPDVSVTLSGSQLRRGKCVRAFIVSSHRRQPWKQATSAAQRNPRGLCFFRRRALSFSSPLACFSPNLLLSCSSSESRSSDYNVVIW